MLDISLTPSTGGMAMPAPTIVPPPRLARGHDNAALLRRATQTGRTVRRAAIGLGLRLLRAGQVFLGRCRKDLDSHCAGAANIRRARAYHYGKPRFDCKPARQQRGLHAGRRCSDIFQTRLPLARFEQGNQSGDLGGIRFRLVVGNRIIEIGVVVPFRERREKRPGPFVAGPPQGRAAQIGQ